MKVLHPFPQFLLCATEAKKLPQFSEKDNIYPQYTAEEKARRVDPAKPVAPHRVQWKAVSMQSFVQPPPHSVETSAKSLNVIT